MKLPPNYIIFQAKDISNYGDIKNDKINPEIPTNRQKWVFQPKNFEGRWFSPFYKSKPEVIKAAWDYYQSTITVIKVKK